MKNLRGTALVTGASTGIGYELASLLGCQGYSLILIAKNSDRLRKAAEGLQSRHGVDIHVIAADLATPGAARGIFEQVSRLDITPDILVNNAGFGTYGLFFQTNLEEERDMIAVNISALTELTKFFLPGMLARKSGRILNVASTASFQAGPRMAVYYATKAYVLSFSEALAQELRGTGVTVTALCPGLTRSEFQKRAGIERIRLMSLIMMMSPEKVARKGLEALMRGRRICVPGILSKLFIFMLRLAPRAWVPPVVSMLQREAFAK